MNLNFDDNICTSCTIKQIILDFLLYKDENFEAYMSDAEFINNFIKEYLSKERV